MDKDDKKSCTLHSRENFAGPSNIGSRQFEAFEEPVSFELSIRVKSLEQRILVLESKKEQFNFIRLDDDEESTINNLILQVPFNEIEEMKKAEDIIQSA